MKTYTLNDIRWCGPCYDPATLVPEDWTGTLLDILDFPDCWMEDRLWAVLSLLPERRAIAAGIMLIRQTPLGDGRLVGDLLTEQDQVNAILKLLDKAVEQDWDTYLAMTDAWAPLAAQICATCDTYDVTSPSPHVPVLLATQAVANLWDSVYDASTDACAAAHRDLNVTYSDESWNAIRLAQGELLRAFIQTLEDEDG